MSENGKCVFVPGAVFTVLAGEAVVYPRIGIVVHLPRPPAPRPLCPPVPRPRPVAAPKPKKLGLNDVPVAKTVRACSRLPGPIRQKLIAALIDLANDANARSHTNYNRHHTLSAAFSWSRFNPFNVDSPARMWLAVDRVVTGETEWDSVLQNRYAASILAYRR